MTDSLSCSHEAFERDLAEGLAAAPLSDWQMRRMDGFGCSELGALFCALGRHTEATTSYVRKAASRLFAVKAGKARPHKAGSAAEIGIARERELVMRWRRQVENGEDGEPSTLLDPASITHADAVPGEWLPLVDRVTPRLLDTPDAWARLHCGCGVVVQAKCTTYDMVEPPPHYVLQVQGEMAVTGTSVALLVCGIGWAATWWAEDGPIRTWAIERDETTISAIREAVRAGWERVEVLRAA